MSLATRDPATGLRHDGIRWPNGRPPTPSGCRWCGYEQRHHYQHWVGARGWHGWEQPTQAQILARMRARRINRFRATHQVAPPAGLFVTLTADDTELRRAWRTAWRRITELTAQEQPR